MNVKPFIIHDDPIKFAKVNFNQIDWKSFSNREDFPEYATRSNTLIRGSNEHEEFKVLFDKYFFPNKQPNERGCSFHFIIRTLNAFAIAWKNN
jgi:hypothetical protein